MRHTNPRLRPRRPSPVSPPTPQALEPRVLLAAVLTPDGTLAVTGTDGVDEVTVRRGSNPADLHVQEGTATLHIYALDRVRTLAIDLGAGDDVLHLDQANGLLTGAAGGQLTIGVNGGFGNDTFVVVGTPAAGAVDQVLTIGPDAGGGTLVSRSGAGAGTTQTVRFSGIESLVDTSAAASLTIVANDANGTVVGGVRNVIELSAGSLAGGVTQTATARFYDVTSHAAAAQVPASAAAQPAAAGAADPGPEAGLSQPPHPAAAAAEDPSDPAARRRAKQAAKEARRAAQRQAKLAKREAQRLAREQRQAAKRGRAGAHTAAANATAAERLAVNAAHLAVHFANKSAVMFQTGAADDRVDVNLPVAPAGLQSLTIDGGTGADRLAEASLPPGVTVQRPNVEATSPARDWVLVNPTPPSPGPAPLPTTPAPVPPPAPSPGGSAGGDAGSSASTSSRDRDESSSGSASSSRDASASSSVATSSRDADASGSADRDTSSSRDASASGGD